MRAVQMGMVAALLVLSTGCKKSPDFGLAIAVTIDASRLSVATRAGIRGLQVVASGAESFSGTMPLSSGLRAIERTVYKPQVSSGSLTIAITAIEGSSTPAGFGMATVTLAAGKTVEATIVLTTDVPAMPDLAPTPDLKPAVVVDLSPPDLPEQDLSGEPVDMAVPPDLTDVPDLRQILDFTLPPGNHTGHAEALAGGAVRIEVPDGGTKKITLSVGGKLSGKAIGPAHRIHFGAVRGTEP